METTGIADFCNRKQFTVANGNCSSEEELDAICHLYLGLSPENLLRKKSVEQTW